MTPPHDPVARTHRGDTQWIYTGISPKWWFTRGKVIGFSLPGTGAMSVLPMGLISSMYPLWMNLLAGLVIAGSCVVLYIDLFYRSTTKTPPEDAALGTPPYEPTDEVPL